MVWENLASLHWLEFLWATTVKGTFLLLGIWAAAWAWRRASASARHLIWSLAFYGTVLIMIGFIGLPRWHVGMPAPFPSIEALMQKGISLLSHRAGGGGEFTLAREAAEASDGASRIAASPFSVQTDNLETLLLAIWAIGFALLYSRFWLGVLNIYRLTRAARPATSRDWRAIVDELNRELQLNRPFRVKVGRGNHTPMAWGIWRPVIVLPKSADSWCPERRRMVLTHEAAHIEKRDYLSLILIHFVRAFYWYNPLIWKAFRELVREREHACDDRVLCLGARATTYADHLLEIARSLKSNPFPGFLSLSMVKTSELEGRLISLLDEEVSHNRLTKPFLFKALLLCFAFVLPLAALKPWTGEPPEIRLRSFDHPLAGGLQFSPAERRRMAAEGVSAEYVNRLVSAGYRNPSVDQIIRLATMGFDPATIEKARRTPAPPVRIVTDRNRVCMLANEILEEPGMALEIDGKIYRGTPSCTVVLAQNPVLRLAYDPVSGHLLDKANAVLATFPDGRLLYFESEENVQQFNRLRETNLKP